MPLLWTGTDAGQKTGPPRPVGHKKGAEVVKEITRAAGELGVKYLTLYAFSTENWQRDPEEVATLMGLLRDYLKSDLKEIQENGVRIIFIGERQMLDADIVEQMAKIEAETAHNDKMTLCIAISYGARQEIVNAARKIAVLARRGDILPEDVDIKMFSDMLYTKDVPDPDLVIRTSGEQRISNYLFVADCLCRIFLYPDFVAGFRQRRVGTDY